MRGILETERLTLIAAGPALLRLDPAALGVALHAAVPVDWPPGEFDRDASEFFIAQHAALGDAAEGWFAWFVVERAAARLVGAGGYFGPPDARGKVEIGYSVSEGSRRRGIANEIVRALVDQAFARGASRVIAHTAADNRASRGALDKCGFRPGVSERDGLSMFERGPTSPS